MANRNTNNLKILYWNARSIQNKIDETFSYLIENQIDIALFQETYLKPTNSFSHIDFKCYRLDRLDEKGGGVAIVIKRSISHSLLPSFNTRIIDCIGINIKTNTNSINIISSYFSGSDLSREAMIDFKHDIQILTQSNDSYLICGDFNAKHRFWNCIRGNRAGAIIYELLTNGQFTISYPPEPTHYPTQRRYKPSTIDIVLTNGRHNITQPSVATPGLFSDHQPIEFYLQCDNIRHVPSHFIPCYKKANWNLYRQFLKENLNTSHFSLEEITSTSIIDEMIEHITSVINQAKDLSVPLVQPHYSNIVFPPELISKIQLRKTLGRHWNRFHQPITKTIINFLTNSIKTDIKWLKNRRWGLMLENINVQNNSTKLWKTTKIIKKQIKHTPPLKVNGLTLLTDNEKANALSDQFIKAHEITQNYRNSQVDNDVQSSINFLNNTPPNSIDPTILTKPSEIKETIKHLKNNKAPGPDQIPNILLKQLPIKAIVYLTYIFNACIILSYFPNNWKEALITAVPKSDKDLTKPISYRPISLLNTISKIFEKILLNRIDKHIDEHNIIPNSHFGFRQFHSATQQVFRLTQHIKTGFNNKMSTGMVLFDGEKAFDTVWHDGLIHKLLKLNFPIYLVKLIQSFLTNRKFKVKVNCSFSELKTILAGVPQGSRLSPKLYSVFLSDFPEIRDIITAFFADDLAILTTSTSRNIIQTKLQTAINKIHLYFTKWRLKINPDKSQSIFFTRRRKPIFLPNRKLTINNIEIEWLSQVKYLGIILDKKLIFSHHVTNVIQKTQKYIKILYPFINRKSKLFTKTKIMLFKVVFQSLMLYGAPVWQHCKNIHKKKLQTQQNKILKMMLNLPFFFSTNRLHSISKVQPITTLIESRTSKFQERCQESTNPLIRNLFS